MSKVCITHIRKNGKQRGKKLQFIDSYEPKGYSEEIKRECLVGKKPL